MKNTYKYILGSVVIFGGIFMILLLREKKKNVFISTETDPLKRQMQEALAKSYGMEFK